MSVNYTEIMTEHFSRLEYPKSLVKMTQPRDHEETFFRRTIDGVQLALEVYRVHASQWFVILTADSGVAALTTSSEAAFGILHNCEVFTANELKTMAAKAKS